MDEEAALELYWHALQRPLTPSELSRMRVLLVRENPAATILEDNQVVEATGIAIGVRIAYRRLMGMEDSGSGVAAG